MHTAKRSQAEAAERVKVPDYADLLPEEIQPFTTKTFFELDDYKHIAEAAAGAIPTAMHLAFGERPWFLGRSRRLSPASGSCVYYGFDQRPRCISNLRRCNRQTLRAWAFWHISWPLTAERNLSAGIHLAVAVTRI